MSAVLPTNPAAPVARSQRTLKSPVEYRGIGLHSGKEIKIVVRPAEAGTGVPAVSGVNSLSVGVGAGAGVVVGAACESAESPALPDEVFAS